MSKQSHTPGPWHYIRQSNDNGEPVYSVGSEYAEGENKHIARVATAAGWSDVDGKTHRVERPAEANARLIAAAPEMLEALQQVLGLLPDIEGEGPLSTIENILEYAIAKAEGRVE